MLLDRSWLQVAAKLQVVNQHFMQLGVLELLDTLWQLFASSSRFALDFFVLETTHRHIGRMRG